MGNFVLAEIVNSNPLSVRADSVANPFWFGSEICITPNVPGDVTKNPWYLGSKMRYKQFGSICVGRNNVGYLVTRISNAHGYDEANLYWSKTEDEGLTWSAPVRFEQDIAGIGEDLRDCTLTYDPLIDKYLLVYTKQFNITDHTNYDNADGYLKVWIGDEPFVGMIEISPGIIPLNGVSGSYISAETFETFHRIGTNLYLPCYKWSSSVEPDEPRMGSMLLKLEYNDTLPLSTGVTYMSWTTVKEWELNNDNETTMYVTYQQTGEPRINLLSRGGLNDGRFSYSDDGGVNWSEKSNIGFKTGGGPRVFEINGKYMLIAREAGIDGLSNVFAMFSSDGLTWSNRIMISDCATGYASLAQFRSGKTLICYSKEYRHLGVQCIKQLFSLPI